MASTTDRLTSDAQSSLMTADDPSPVDIVNPGGASSFLLIGDHAGNRLPASLGTMGVAAADLERHIAWDIGIAGLGKALAGMLDAVFISQRYSRLVIDCNRDPAAEDSMPAISDGTDIVANRALPASARSAREATIHQPYHDAIADELVRRDAAGLETVLVALHSFTPSMRGVDRPWQIGILHGGGNESFAIRLLRDLVADGELVVGDNEPYAMDGIDYTIPRHAFSSQRPYVEIEIRQDLLASEEQQVVWARRLERVLRRASRWP